MARAALGKGHIDHVIRDCQNFTELRHVTNKEHVLYVGNIIRVDVKGIGNYKIKNLQGDQALTFIWSSRHAGYPVKSRSVISLIKNLSLMSIRLTLIMRPIFCDLVIFRKVPLFLMKLWFHFLLLNIFVNVDYDTYHDIIRIYFLIIVWLNYPNKGMLCDVSKRK